MLFFYRLQPLDFQGAVFITKIPKGKIQENTLIQQVLN